MATEWFCQIDHDEYGPLSSAALRELVAAGRLSASDRVRKGRGGNWVTASRVSGLFDGTHSLAKSPPRPVAVAEPEPDEYVLAEAVPDSDEYEVREPTAKPPRSRGFQNVRSIGQCISKEERKQRFSVMILSALLWIVLVIVLTVFAVGSYGVLLIVYGLVWVFGRLFAEYNVRKLQAIGTAATPEQFPEIADALNDVCAVQRRPSAESHRAQRPDAERLRAQDRAEARHRALIRDARGSSRSARGAAFLFGARVSTYPARSRLERCLRAL